MSIELEPFPNVAESAPAVLGYDEAVTTKPDSAPGPQATARLIEYAPGRHIALPPHTTYALIEHPTVEVIPGAAHYACGFLTWQDTRLPLLDLDALLHGNALAASPRYALIVAYQNVVGGPLAFGAIGLSALPQTITVGDEAQCPLPDDSRLWPALALSCFVDKGQAVPILDTTRLFAAYHG